LVAAASDAGRLLGRRDCAWKDGLDGNGMDGAVGESGPRFAASPSPSPPLLPKAPRLPNEPEAPVAPAAPHGEAAGGGLPQPYAGAPMPVAIASRLLLLPPPAI
jgi:hypothetical protein